MTKQTYENIYKICRELPATADLTNAQLSYILRQICIIIESPEGQLLFAVQLLQTQLSIMGK